MFHRLVRLAALIGSTVLAGHAGAQAVPEVALDAPRLVIAAPAESPVALRAVRVRTEINGRSALTSIELTFHNPNARQLEGELQFPLREGQTVVGLGRRAKYLMADLSSGDVLLMHLGMSGSFRVLDGGSKTTPGQFHHPRGDERAHDHVVFHMSSGAAIVFNDPRRFGYMKIIARSALGVSRVPPSSGVARAILRRRTTLNAKVALAASATRLPAV